MSDYKESTIAGTVWQRCHEIVVSNTRGAVPRIQFFEERVIALEGAGEIRQTLGPLEVAFDPALVVQILDPTTGQPTGASATYGEAYVLLYSAYLAAALARDALIPPPVTETPIQGA